MRGNQKNKDYKMKWTPEFAYAIGLLTTDGNLSIDGRHIEFTSKDIQLVRLFKKCMNLKGVKIGKKKNGYSDKKYYRIQFSNVRFHKKLLKIGLMPNKSKRIKRLKIPEKYFFDFLRGCFDGDGSFYSYWDPRWKSSFMFYTTFSSGSLAFIKWLRKKIKTLLNIEGHIDPNGSKQEWELKFAKKESKVIIPRMYYRISIPHLQRKYKKVIEALKTEEIMRTWRNLENAQA
jgi:intein-encoded DNA endonuclease-like protein